MGKVFIYVSRAGPVLTGTSYPGLNKFGDEGRNASKGNLIYFSRNDDDTERQFKYFMIEDSSGLSQAGLSRLNQSIEAFVYSILGALVNVRSSILGNSGSAKEAQTEF